MKRTTCEHPPTTTVIYDEDASRCPLCLEIEKLRAALRREEALQDVLETKVVS